MQDQRATLDASLKRQPIDKSLISAEIDPRGPVIPDVVCPRCGSLAPPSKVEDRGTYMIYKRRCPTKLPTADGVVTCGPVANVGTHEEFQKLQPANMQFTQQQFQQIMNLLMVNAASKSLEGSGASA